MIRDIYYGIAHFFNYHSMWLIIAGISVFALLWGLLEVLLHRHAGLYTVVNAALLTLTASAILGCTLLFRQSDVRSVSLIPFDYVFQAMDNQVLFKSMAMNVTLFIPLSLFGFSLLRCRTAKATILFLAAGIAFSVLIETLQYAFALGQADADDVICNTLGLLIGWLLYWLHNRYIMKLKRK